MRSYANIFAQSKPFAKIHQRRNNGLRRVRISFADPDPHLKSPPGSAWRNADPDPGGKKA